MRTTGAIAVVCGVVSSLVLGCGSGEPSAEARRVAADALGSGAYVVYGDALASGWVDWSWSATRNFSNSSPVASGTASVAATLQGWGGLSMHALSSTVTGMSALVLSVNGGTASGGDLQVSVTVGGTAKTAVMLAQYCAGKVIPANAWTRCTVPLSAMGAAGQALDGVYLRDITGSARPTFYVDDVGFVPAAPAAPAGLTAVASTGAVALTWSTSTGATGYDVYRATASSGPFSKLSASPQTTSTYLDTAVTAGTTYWYQVTASNSGGTSASSAAASATVPVPVPAPASSFVVYGDALASGWVDWSWSSTRNFSNPSPVASGTASVAVTLQGWGALSMHALSSTVTGTSALVLSVNGGAASGGDLQVGVTVGGTAQTPVMLAQYCAGKVIPANAWTRCTVPLSAMGAAGQALDGVYLRDITGSARPTLYVDDIAFTGSSSSSSSSGGGSSSSSSSGGSSSSSSGGGSSSSSSGGAPAVTVTVSPAASILDGCASAQLTATVTGASDTSVTWSVQEGTAGGTVSSTGKYTAPTAPGTYHVVAKSNAGAATAIATFTVQEHVLAVQITPGTVRVTPGGQVAFAATATTTCGTFALQ